ncbi:hypothetical protein HPB51_024840 [Rhipicephalus microplus]|uniref:Tick transposon n=1 Tax=Rhipicephalus microplus TaxID=6941 RepID=A0A9J6DDG7_RHIMP|nr:hypothetical protein HPB51_024840 [Rhipicephalus microplus]
MHYAVALLLRQLLYIQGNSAISLSELALRAKHASSPVTQYLSATASAETEMSKVLLVHSDIFRFHATTENVELRSKLPPGAHWNSDSELLVTAYFVYVLRDINATSPARAVCFNYIICAASSAPPKCKEHLNTFYPGLEIIDTENKDETHQVSQKATTRLNNKFKLQDPERTLHQVPEDGQRHHLRHLDRSLRFSLCFFHRSLSTFLPFRKCASLESMAPPCPRLFL